MDLNEMFKRDRQHAIAWAAAALADEGAVILDTETTGLGDYDQVIEVSVIDIHGNVLLDTLCRHNLERVPQAASQVHGITDEALVEAPAFPQVYEELKRIFQRASRVIVYNAAYDARLIEQTMNGWDLPNFESAPFDCAMLAYAQFAGQWNEYHQSYRWQRLNGGHRALDDCRACLERIRTMAKAVQNDR